MSRLRIEFDRLAEIALGDLPTDEELRALDEDPALAAELARMEDGLGLGVEPEPPPPPLRARLLADTVEPWWRALDALTRLVDLSAEVVKGVLQEARRKAWEFWEETGVELYHFGGGPITAGADVGLVRAGPNHLFLPHRHKGPEHIVILEGSMYTEGRWLRVGDTDLMGSGSDHEWRAGPDGVVFAVVLFDGIELLSR